MQRRRLPQQRISPSKTDWRLHCWRQWLLLSYVPGLLSEEPYSRPRVPGEPAMDIPPYNISCRSLGLNADNPGYKCQSSSVFYEYRWSEHRSPQYGQSVFPQQLLRLPSWVHQNVRRSGSSLCCSWSQESLPKARRQPLQFPHNAV